MLICPSLFKYTQDDIVINMWNGVDDNNELVNFIKERAHTVLEANKQGFTRH